MGIRLYIVGIKHCGKSSVGRVLAKELSIPYFDLDDLIEKQVETNVRDFYIKHGKDAFQNQETDELKKLMDSVHNSFICATGGGICDNGKVVDLLKSSDSKIYINTSFDTVYSRIVKNGIPPFLKTNDPQNEFKHMYNSRTKKYKTMCNIEVDGDNKTPDQIKIEILNKLKEQQIARK